ncbi:MAG: DUF4297 domain-containing protein [Clostridia bacterium]|nr:DUF4297 domain-containing protein [Clostridia bacterium]
MNLMETLSKTEERENGGAIANHRFEFQEHWALIKLLELFVDNEDFMLIMEFHDDVMVLDKSLNPSLMELYQIKTNTKKVKNINPTNKENLEYLRKLISNYSKFEKHITNIYFISNKHFKIGLNDIKDSTTLNQIRLKDIKDVEMKKIKESICAECKKQNCNEECRDVILFKKSKLPFENFNEISYGRLIEFLKKVGNPNLEDVDAIYFALLSQIRLVNNVEEKAKDFEDLIKNKSITKKKMEEYMNGLKSKIELRKDLSSIRTFLIESGFNPMEAIKIVNEWKKYFKDKINQNTMLDEIEDSIYEILRTKIDLSDDLKIIVNETCNELIEKKKFDEDIISKEYVKSMILERVINGEN